MNLSDLFSPLTNDPLGLVAAGGLSLVLLNKAANFLTEALTELRWLVVDLVGDRNAKILELVIEAKADGKFTAEELQAILAEIRSTTSAPSGDTALKAIATSLRHPELD